jgi:hypothetical protein
VSDKVYIRQLSGASLARLLAVLRPWLSFAILERVDAVDFPTSHEPLSPTDWPLGRAFGPSLEVRWEARGARFHTLLVCDRAPSARWVEHLDLTQCEDITRSYYLWGPGNVALGRELSYRAMPSGSGRPQLLVTEYHDAGDGRLLFARHIEMRWEGQA